jgi:protein-tyrosine phosphatase
VEAQHESSDPGSDRHKRKPLTSLGGQIQSSDASSRRRQLANLRDLAGLRLIGGGTIPAGILYRSDAPYPGDAVPCSVPVWPPATVIDLRSAGETFAGHRWPDGTTLYNIPLMDEADVIGAARDPRWPAALPASLELLYQHVLVIVPQRLASLFALAADSTGPVLVHCTAGKDRTGIAIAILLLVGGAEPADIIADYTASEANMAVLIHRLKALGRSLPADMDITSSRLRARRPRLASSSTGSPNGPAARKSGRRHMASRPRTCDVGENI